MVDGGGGEMNELIGIVGRLQKLRVPDFKFKREPPCFLNAKNVIWPLIVQSLSSTRHAALSMFFKC